MTKLKIKGHEIEAPRVVDSFNRRAVMFQNKIIAALKKAEIKKDQIDVPLEGLLGKKAKAFALWYGHGHRMYYSANSQGKFIDNLQLVCKVIEAETNLVESGEKSISEFVEEFREDEDIEEKRKDAREFLGIEEDSTDVELINKRYKEMAKDHHPDTPTGSTEKFKKLNNAHKTLKRELT